MVKVETFRIELNRQEGDFIPGQVIGGRVILENKTCMPMRGVALHVHGKGKVEWTGGDDQNPVIYGSDEIYLDHCITLYGKPYNEREECSMIDPGRWTYTFEYELPSTGLPSSFTGSYGGVSYYLEAVIDTPKDKKNIKMPFKLFRTLDLNREPVILKIPEAHLAEDVDCMCCKSGSVTASVRLNRAIFVPGEDIIIYADVNNRSNKNVEKTKAELMQVITYHAKDLDNIVQLRLSKLGRSTAIHREKSDTWVGEKLHIPDVPPSRHDDCSLIDIRYYVKIFKFRH